MTRKSGYLFFISVFFLLQIILSACTGGLRNDLLNGTAWILTSIDNVPPLKGTSLTAEFRDGQIRGSSGCNSFSGSYETKKDKIAISSIAMTLMACADPGLMDQEQAYLEHLQDALTFTLENGQLHIFGSDGKSLIFIPGT